MWYRAFPLTAYIALLIAAMALLANPALALYLISAEMAALLFLGIHNAWDLVIYFAVARPQADNPRRGWRYL